MANTLFDTRFLNSARIQRIIETPASELERQRPLVYLDRLTEVNAVDDEIMGRFTAKQLTADIIADGQKALVYEGGTFELVTNQLPNVKIGQNLTQANLNLLSRLVEFPRAQEEDAWFDWEWNFGRNLVQAVRERLNVMACGMMIDSLDYDRWGVKLSGVTWGMPSYLKVTPSVLWSTDGGVTANTNATPLEDIWDISNTAAITDGLGPFDRMTLSTKAFNILTKTDEFSERAWAVLKSYFTISRATLPSLAREEKRKMLEQELSVEVVIDDKTFKTQNNDGSYRTTRVLPENKVLLDRKANGAREWDMGNGIVTESIVAGLTGGGPVLGENPRMELGGTYGPLAYYTAQDAQLNPPGVNAWAVQRAFPRKHVIECSAVLTVY